MGTDTEVPLEEQRVEAGQALMSIQLHEQPREDDRSVRSVDQSVPQSKFKVLPWWEFYRPRSVLLCEDTLDQGEDSFRGRLREFAANLSVVLDQTPEQGSAKRTGYADPEECFERTYMTNSLKWLLRLVGLRLMGRAQHGVFIVRSSFGSGKTHALLAAYHLASGIEFSKLFGVPEIFSDTGIASLPNVKRVVLVGTLETPGIPMEYCGGNIKVHTLWGRLAWELGGEEAYREIQHADLTATNPGRVLKDLIRRYAPVLVIIDEWIGYMRQLWRPDAQSDQGREGSPVIPAGDLPTHMSFVHTLTEVFNQVPNCALLVSFPEVNIGSDGKPDARDFYEVGGDVGYEVYNMIFPILSRVGVTWQPESGVDELGILRQQCFYPPREGVQEYVNQLCDEFLKFVTSMHGEQADQEQVQQFVEELRASYPFHPQVRRILSDAWGRFPGFQRVRGMLNVLSRLAWFGYRNQVQQSLIFFDDYLVTERELRDLLLWYLSGSGVLWASVLNTDFLGPQSRLAEIVKRYQDPRYQMICRRVATTIFMATAPYGYRGERYSEAVGISEDVLKQSCFDLGDFPESISSILLEFQENMVYLHKYTRTYWFGTVPSVIAHVKYLVDQHRKTKWLRGVSFVKQVFQRFRQTISLPSPDQETYPKIVIFPDDTSQIPNEYSAFLVVLGPDKPHTGTAFDTGDQGKKQTPAVEFIHQALVFCGSQMRVNRNGLLFLAAEQNELETLDALALECAVCESVLSKRDPTTIPFHAEQLEVVKSHLNFCIAALESAVSQVYRHVLFGTRRNPSGKPSVFRTGQSIGSFVMRYRGSNLLEKVIQECKQCEALSTQRLGAHAIERALTEMNLIETVLPLNTFVEYVFKYHYLPRIAGMDVVYRTIDHIQQHGMRMGGLTYVQRFDPTLDAYVSRRVKLCELTSLGGFLLHTKYHPVMFIPDHGGSPSPEEGHAVEGEQRDKTIHVTFEGTFGDFANFFKLYKPWWDAKLGGKLRLVRSVYELTLQGPEGDILTLNEFLESPLRNNGTAKITVRFP